MASSFNPYAPPQVAELRAASETDAAAESIRRQFIEHEAAVHSIGWVFALSGIVGALMCTVALASDPEMILEPQVLIVAGMAAVAILLFVAGYGLIHLLPWSRIAGQWAAGVSLAAFPLGTLVGGYALCILCAPQAKTVFSPEYRMVVAATPWIEYPRSRALWWFLFIVVVGWVVLLLVFLIRYLFGL